MTYQEASRRAEAREMRRRLNDRIMAHAYRFRANEKWRFYLMALGYGASLATATRARREAVSVVRGQRTMIDVVTEMLREGQA